jgi:hypothetical protein
LDELEVADETVALPGSRGVGQRLVQGTLRRADGQRCDVHPPSCERGHRGIAAYREILKNEADTGYPAFVTRASEPAFA